MDVGIIVKILTWLRKFFRKEEFAYRIKTKTNNSHMVININIAELHYYNSPSTLEDIRSKYKRSKYKNKYIKTSLKYERRTN